LPKLPNKPSSLLTAACSHAFRHRVIGMSSADKYIFEQLVASARRRGRTVRRASFQNMVIKDIKKDINVQIHDGRYILYEVTSSERGDNIDLLYLGYILHENGVFKFDFE
jgi:hypothetical protein